MSLILRHKQTRSCCILFVLLLAGCESGVLLQGMVVDFKGEALPGVAVINSESGSQTITNGQGTYRLRVPLGTVSIEYHKTGYTPGRMELNLQDTRSVDVNNALLWPLPIEKGVYLFVNFQYHDVDRMEPETYQRNNGSPVLALPREPDTETTQQTVRLLCYDMPPFDIRVHRLSELKVKKPMSGAIEETVWGPVENISVFPVGIDEPERLLLEIDILNPLQPGIYAVHWGALDGYTTLDTRCFVFRVIEEKQDLDENSDEEAPEETATS